MLICSFPLLDLPILFAFLIFHLKVYGEEDDELRWQREDYADRSQQFYKRINEDSKNPYENTSLRRSTNSSRASLVPSALD